jgi:hypothetical protein
MPLVFGHKVERTGSSRWQVTLFSTGSAAAFNVLCVARQSDAAGQVVEGDTGVLSFHDPAIGNGYRTRRLSLLSGQSQTFVDRWDDDGKVWVPLVWA